MDKRKVLFKLLPIIVLVSVSIAAGVIGATVIHSMQLENPIKTPVVEGGVTENLDQGAKEASFTNNGEADAFLKVASVQSWVAQDGTVLLNHITDVFDQPPPVAVSSLSLDGNWESGEDRWYYYKRVPPGFVSSIRDRSTKRLARGVGFIELSGIKDQRYQNTEYQFHFTLEIVQFSDAWNVSRKAVQWLSDRDISVTPDSQDGDKYGCSINWNADFGKNQEVVVLKRLEIHPWLKSKKTAGLLILVILLLSFVVTLACYNEVLALANPLGTFYSGAAMVESFDPGSSFLLGEIVIKEVSSRNTGKMDLFLRVEVSPQENWYQKGQGDSSPVIFEEEADHDMDHVIKHWNPRVWTDSGQEEGNVDYMNMETAPWSKSYTDENGKSYRYYKQVLLAGKATDCILGSISLSDEASNDRHDVDYSDKIYKLTFHVETVSVEEHDPALGVQSQWSMVVQEDSSGVPTRSRGIRAGE